METTESELEPVPHQEPIMVLNQEAQYYLQQAGKWASFLGIVGFILCGLLFVAALCIGTIFTFFAKMSPQAGPSNTALTTMGPAFSVIYIIIDVIYFMLVLYLYQFGSRVKKGLAFIDNDSVTSGLSKLKSFFKAWGIITIVFVSIYGLIIIGFIIGAATMMR